MEGRHRSLWLDTTEPRPEYPPLDGDTHVDVAVVGATAAAEDAQRRQALAQLAIGVRKLGRVAFVERLRLVQLGMAQLRGVGANVRFGSKADVTAATGNVRFVP